jgi:serine phosphatase RsbU (regulator of sigma subunit)
VGDVRGKGLDAIRLSVVVLGLFRKSAAVEQPLDAVAKAVDDALASHLEDEDFVTAVFLEFTAGEVAVVNCGHYAPLRITPTGMEALHPTEPTVPLGLGPRFVVESYPLPDGDRLLVYTDGLVEARGRDGSFFDLDRLPAVFFRHGDLETTLDALVQRLLAHAGGRLNDDLALVLAQPAHT